MITSNTLTSKIAKVVHNNKEAYIDFLKEMIRLDTTHEREKAGQDLILSRLKNLPCEIDIFEPDTDRLQQ